MDFDNRKVYSDTSITDGLVIVNSVQAVYRALLPPSLMSDGIFSEKIVYFFEVMSLLGHILRKKEC